MNFFSIKNKIFLIFLVVISISVLVVGYLGYASAERSYINSALETSKNKTELLSKTIEEQSSTIPSDLKYFANFYALQRYFIWKSIGEKNKENQLEDKFSDALLDFMKKRELYHEISVLDINGKELFSYKYESTLKRSYKKHDKFLKDLASMSCFKKTISLDKGEFFISDLKLNRVNQIIEKPYNPIIKFATPIVDKNGEKHGVLVANVYASKFIDLIKSSDNSNGVSYFLIDKDGSYIYAQDIEKQWSKQLNNSYNFNNDFGDSLKNANKKVFMHDGKILSFTKLHPYVKYDDIYFYLVSKIDTSYALKDLNDFTKKFFIVIILVFVFAYFVITYNILKMTKPLNLVTNKLNSLAKGEMVSYDIQYSSNDEIKQLIKSSNQLVNSLEKTINQAKAISQGDFSKSFKPQSKNDELGLAISNMTKRLNEVSKLAIMISNGNYDVTVDCKNDEDVLGHALNNMIVYLNDITKVVESISSGDLDVNYIVKNSDDKLGFAISNMSEYLKTISQHANNLANDDFDTNIEPKSKVDDLGISLSLMTKKLKSSFEKNRDDIWFSTGINNFTLNLKNFDTIDKLCQNAISNVTRYLNAAMAIVYIYDKQKKVLEFSSSFAYEKDANFKSTITLGEGVLGQVALDKKEILNTKLDDLRVSTALISKGINETFCLPIVYEKELYAVVEIATIRSFTEQEKNYILKIAEIFASMFHRTALNIQVKELLEESQQAYEELQTNSEELQATNEQMQEQAVILEKQAKDLTQQNVKLEKAQIEIDNRAKELEKSNEYKSEFLANMSHELRTPLNSIILLSSLLQRNSGENLNKKDIEKLDVINQSGSELLRLINDILDLSKIEANKMNLIVDKVQTEEFLKQNSDAFKYFAQNSDIEFIIKDKFKGVFYNDANRLSQVLRNLLSNAFKFTKQGFVSLEISPSDKKEYAVKIEVKDSGIGISKEKQEQIFKAFVQADGSTSREFGGTGLGLSISKELVNLMKGLIVLKSESFEGSTFAIYLPSLEEDFIPAESHKLVPKKDISKDYIVSKDPAIKKVLVIEDDELHQQAMGEYLKDSIEVDVDYACGVKEAKELLLEKSYDLVIVDLNLKDGKGKDICLFVKENDIKTTVIIYTAQELNEKEEDYLKSVSDEIIIKNFNSHQRFKDEVKRFLSNDNVQAKNDISPVCKVEGFAANMHGKKALVVDDDIKNIFVLSTTLKEQGMEVIHAKNGKEALNVLEKDNSIDIVLMDIMMPVMNGYDAMKAIRESSNYSKIPIIAVTAKAMSDDKDKAIECGADDYLTKPIDLDRLISMVSMWLNKN